MVVVCLKCQLRYDDASRWTICPHNNLIVPADAVYCRRCDLYVGYTNLLTPTLSDQCLACGRTAVEIRVDALLGESRHAAP